MSRPATLLALLLLFPAAHAAPQRPPRIDGFASAVALSRGGSVDTAVGAWSALARRHPTSPEIRNNLAIALARAGRSGEARLALEQASRLQPKYASIQRNLELPEDLWLPIEAMPGRGAARVVAMTAAQAGVAAAVEPAAGEAGPTHPEAAGALRAWAAAWQARDVDAYLAAYHPDFAVPGGAERAAWEAERRRRILSKKSIRVTVREAAWSAPDGADTAVVRFVQDYEATGLRERSRKQITFRLSDGAWRIVEERSQ